MPLSIHSIFYLLVSSHFYIHSVYVLSVNGDDALWSMKVLKGEEEKSA